jgi:hypothetical protein
LWQSVFLCDLRSYRLWLFLDPDPDIIDLACCHPWQRLTVQVFFLKGETLKTKLSIGTSMIPRGEVGLICASIGVTSGAISSEVYASLILVITLTTVFIPFGLRFVFGLKEKKRS